jgi:hypothetical protein
MDKKRVISWAVALGMLLPVIVLILWGIGYVMIYLPAKFEADAFNKFSDKKATWQDAIFVDLKVTSQ